MVQHEQQFRRRVESPAMGMKEIRDGLWIGDIASAAKVLSSPNHMGITHILSLASSTILSSFCTPAAPPSRTAGAFEQRPISTSLEVAKQGPHLVRMVVPLNDTRDQFILDILQPCFEFIDEGRRQGGAVLVHCVAGVSRSAAVVTAYLMKTEKLPWRAALNSLKKKHKRASPNLGFLQQLQLFEKRGFTFGKSSYGQTEWLVHEEDMEELKID